jgi:hypothetical protein
MIAVKTIKGCAEIVNMLVKCCRAYNYVKHVGI